MRSRDEAGTSLTSFASSAPSGERGTVTAESAMVLPIVAAFALVMVWLVSVGVTQIETVDAARDAARALARGEDEDAVVSAVRRTAPYPATVSVAHADGTVTVNVSAATKAPGWLLVPLPTITVDAASTVAVETDDVVD